MLPRLTCRCRESQWGKGSSLSEEMDVVRHEMVKRVDKDITSSSQIRKKIMGNLFENEQEVGDFCFE